MLIIEKVLLLKNSTIFQSCREADLIDIASICTENYFDKNITLFSKGDPGNCMYFIYKGNVSIHDGQHQLAELGENEIFGELSLLDSESRSASYKGNVSIHDGQHQLAELGENEIFGELSLLDSESRSASATTVTDCTLLKIEQEPFYDVVATNTDILKGIMRTLCKRLREQDRITVEMKNERFWETAARQLT